MTKDQEAAKALEDYLAQCGVLRMEPDQRKLKTLVSAIRPALKRLVDQGERGFCTYNGPCDYRLGRPITTDSKPAESGDKRSDVSGK